MPVLEIAEEISLYHHEKWYGTGYPEGLAGDSIPISARIMAIADVYDALISRRVYKGGALAHGEAMRIIVDGKATHFDPSMVEAWLSIQDQIESMVLGFGPGI